MIGATWVGMFVAQTTLPADTLAIRFIGNAAFVLSDGETTLVTDFPYRSGAFGYMEYDPSDAPGEPATAVVTHRHDDHFDAVLFAGNDWYLIAPPDVGARVDPARVIAVDGAVRVGAFTVTPFTTPHGEPQHWSYEIRWRDRRLYFTGDTETPSHLLRMSGLDVAFVTPWLLCTIRDRGLEIPAERVVVHHQFPDGRSRICGNPRVMGQGEVFTLGSGFR